MDPTFTVAYRGKMFEVVNWEGKPGITFEAAVRAPGVRLLIETVKDGQKAILMTREIRREAGGYDFRLPGGKVFDSLDELDEQRSSGVDILPLAIKAAQREGREEAGVMGGKYDLIEITKAGASIEWDLYYFLVTGADIGEQELEDREIGDIETVTLSAVEVFQKLCNREIKEGRSADIIWSWLNQNGFISFNN